MTTWDVAVVGAGNAALCAAITARLQGAQVVVIEKSAEWERGGNSKFTRNVRRATDGRGGPGLYTCGAFLRDIMSVSHGDTDINLATLLAERSGDLVQWMSALGVRWQRAITGTLQLSSTNAFFLGGGKALLNHYHGVCQRLGIRVWYEAEVTGLRPEGWGVSLQVTRHGATEEVRARACVVASGGYEGNRAWLKLQHGEKADGFVIRGYHGNDGAVIDALFGIGARACGVADEFHAIAVDARSPRSDGGIVTRVDAIPYGIVVNSQGKRFYDEGEDLWPKRYAMWGALISGQPGQIAFAVYDSSVKPGAFVPPVYRPVVGESVHALGCKMGLVGDALVDTIREYNEAVPEALPPPDYTDLDGRGTSGLAPPKSNWAAKVELAPFFAYPLRPGVTFTYRGVQVDESARVISMQGEPIPGVFAAGEVMAGNILRHGYLAGIGTTIGGVFGRIAGDGAARLAGE